MAKDNSTKAKMDATARARRMAIMQVDARRQGRQNGQVPSIFDEPHKTLLTEAEAIEYLRLDVLCGPAKAKDALDRLCYAKRRIRPIVYAGPGGGRRIFPRRELEEFIEGMMRGGND